MYQRDSCENMKEFVMMCYFTDLLRANRRVKQGTFDFAIKLYYTIIVWSGM